MKTALLGVALALAAACGGATGGKSAHDGATYAGGSGGNGGASSAPGTGGSGGADVSPGGGGGATSPVASGGGAGTDGPIASGGNGGAAGGARDSGNGGAIGHGGVPSGTPVAIADYAAEYASAVCDSVAACCQASPYGWDEGGCLSATKAISSGYEAVLSVGGVKWDAEAAGTCIAYVRRNYAGCPPPPDLDMDRVCANLFVGSKPPGAPCTSQYQCATPAKGEARCLPFATDGGGSLVCMVNPSNYDRGKLGDPCHQSCNYTPIGISCDGSTWKDPSDPSAVTDVPLTCYKNDGLRCDSSTGTCVPLAKSGEACSGSADCESALYCKSSKCVPREALGAVCTRSGAGCVAGAYCDPQALTCVPALADGQSCGDSGMCLSGACQSGTKVCGQARLGFASPQQCTGVR
jgi:hypothetical protein